MLIFHFGPRFKRSYRKRPEHIKDQIRGRLRLFAEDQTHALLNDHPLHGALRGVRSFSVTGGLRVQYEYVSDKVVKLIDLGTHSELYGK